MSQEIQQSMQTLLEDLLNKMAVPYTGVEITVTDGVIYHANILTPEASMLIGHNGENLQALQYLMKSLLWRTKVIEEQVVFVVDVDNYKKRYEDRLLKLAEERVERVRENNSRETLPPMTPYHRRLVHLHLTTPQFSDISTESIGEGDNRRIVIKKA